METQTAVENETKITVLADVPRSENDIYRISRKDYKGKQYLDLRIFFRAKNDPATLVASSKGVCFRQMLREDVIAGLIKAKSASTPAIPEGKNIASVTVCDIQVSETELFRISKGCGTKNTFVDVRKFMSRDGNYFPSKRKGITIQESALEEVILGLMQTESANAA